MIYFCLNKNDHSFTLATNIKAVSEFSGEPYHRVYRILSNGLDLHETPDYIYARGKPVKGNQRLPGDNKKEIEKKDKTFDDFFNEIK